MHGGAKEKRDAQNYRPKTWSLRGILFCLFRHLQDTYKQPLHTMRSKSHREAIMMMTTCAELKVMSMNYC